jgi:hypothetical protein
VKTLWSYSEDDVVRLAGPESLVYLSFLKQTAILFMSMFLLGGLPLISQYKKLADDERQTWHFEFAINKLTIKSFEGV